MMEQTPLPASRERRPLGEITPSSPPAWEQTPAPAFRERRPLGELTPSPPPQPRATGGVGRVSASPHRARRALALQRFSLRSRQCAPYPEVPFQPGANCLKPPNRLHRSSELPAAIVKLCSCSWECALKPSAPRLCLRNTEEHDEYRLLEAMFRRYTVERSAQGEAPGPAIARLAAKQELEVHFILEPVQETVVGYIALRKAMPVGTGRMEDMMQEQCAAQLLLYQIYVEPECRRMGYASSALQVILGSSSSVALFTPAPIACQMVERLGFVDSRALGAPDGQDELGWIVFFRDEPSDQWENECARH